MYLACLPVLLETIVFPFSLVSPGLLKQKTKNTQLWLCGLLIFSPNIIIGYRIKEKNSFPSGPLWATQVKGSLNWHQFLMIFAIYSHPLWIIHSCCFLICNLTSVLCACGWKVRLVCSLVVLVKTALLSGWSTFGRDSGQKVLSGCKGGLVLSPPTVNRSWQWPSRWLHKVLFF